MTQIFIDAPERATMPQDNRTRPSAGNLASTAHRTALRHALLDKMRDIVDAKPQGRPALRTELAVIVAELKTYYQPRADDPPTLTTR